MYQFKEMQNLFLEIQDLKEKKWYGFVCWGADLQIILTFLGT